MIREVPERRVVEGVGGHDPFVVVLLLEEELDELLGQLEVLGELPDRETQDRRRRVDSRGASGAVVMVDVVRDRHLLLQRGVVRADRVVDPGALPRQDAAVVRRVVPGEHLGLHRVPVELLVPLDDLRGLVGGDRRRLTIHLQHLRAVRPGDRPIGRVGVRAVADGDADGVALLLENLAVMQQIRPGLGHLQPGLLEVRHVVGSREGNPEPRYGPPSGLRLAALGRERIPAAVPLTERVDEVAHVYDGVENDRSAAWQAGERCVMISIRKQPGTNVVEVVDRIKALLPQMREQLPAAMSLGSTGL